VRQLTWNGTVPAYQAVTFTFVATHTGNYGDAVANTAVFSQAFSDGGAAQTTFSVIGPPQLELSTTVLDFGNQLVGTTSASQTITLSNTGAAPLNLTNVAATNEVNTAPATLKPTTTPDLPNRANSDKK